MEAAFLSFKMGYLEQQKISLQNLVDEVEKDGPPPSQGEVIAESGENGWVNVRWDTGYIRGYRIGSRGKFDLTVVDGGCVTPDTKEDDVQDEMLNKLLVLTGPELAAVMTVGTRVKRGADWCHGNQDGSPPGPGTATRVFHKRNWIHVRWDTGYANNYRMGFNNCYDLMLA